MGQKLYFIPSKWHALVFPVIASTLISACNLDPRGPVDHSIDVPGQAPKARIAKKQIIDVDPEYIRDCRNGVVHLQVFTRGQLSKADIFLPKSAISVFRRRGKSFTYPLSVSLKPQCLKEPDNQSCEEARHVIGLGASISTGNMNILNSMLNSWDLSPAESDVDGLNRFEFDDQKTKAKLDQGKMHPDVYKHLTSGRIGQTNQGYTDFQPEQDVSHRISFLAMCKDVIRDGGRTTTCSYFLASPYNISSGGGMLRDEIGSWEKRTKEAKEIIHMVSKDGSFAQECR